MSFSAEQWQQVQMMAASADVPTDRRPRRRGQGQETVEHIIGGYRTLRILGHGGMSDVYLAIPQDGGFRRQVALKVFHGATDAHELIRRFRSERQILASLDHPGIAKLLDGGTTEDGRPYLVLEHIEGTPIDQYCDHHRLTIRQRLELLLEVCSAVQYAHRNLVVHRDIKPSNILVTSEGVPKLLDFGIAKLLNPNLFPHTVERTQTDVRPMTPQYASPEQLLGHSVTTVSDVYSLGVLLYRLLAGRLPFAISRYRPAELDRMLAGVEPTKPSVAVGEVLEDWDSSTPRSPQWVSLARSVQAQQLRRSLSGDLDRIASMALRREPARRYASVEQLSDDLRRHLDGLPVRARPDTFVYRLSKFLSRNRVAVGLVATVAGLLSLFALTVYFQGQQIARERDLVAIERDKAQQVANFMVELFQVADPGEARGNTVTVREVLDRGAFRVGQDLQDQPEIQATLMHTIGRVYASLGLYDPASDLLRSALQHRRAVPSGDVREVAASAYELARLCMVRGDYAEALELARSAADQQVLIDPQHPDTQASLLLLGHLHREVGDFETSLGHYRSVLREEVPRSPELEQQALQGMAMVSHFQGHYAEALQLYQRIETLQRQVPGLDRFARVQHGLGVLYRDLRQWDKARQYLLESHGVRSELLGPKHHLTVSSHVSLGRLEMIQGHHQEAIEIFEGAIEDTRAFFAESSGDTLTLARLAAAYTDLAGLLQQQGDAARAEELLLESLRLMEPITRDSQVVWFLDAHVRALLLLGRAEEAQPMAERLLASGWVDFGFRDLCWRHGIKPPPRP